ncbi:MAG: hypothetical protein KDD37_01405 [Bdellovibrionales bacterium]|nr:hypothetical protein [Bdellovibrionales bacterium]
MSEKLVSVASDINISSKEIRFTLRPDFKHLLNFESYYSSIKKSFENTSHAFLKRLVNDITCEGSTVIVKLTTVPFTLQHLLSLPDFYLSETEDAGLYSIKTSNPTQIIISKNKKINFSFYKNNFDEVALTQYRDLGQLFNLKSNTCIYTDGMSLDEYASEQYKNYHRIDFKHEWILTLGFNNNKTTLIQRQYIKNIIDEFKKKHSLLTSNGTKWTDQILPEDSSFYAKIDINEPKSELDNFEEIYTLGISKKDYDSSSVVRALAEYIAQKDNMKVQIVGNSDHENIYKDFDIYIAKQGINSSAPSNYYSFLYNFDPLISQYVTEEMLNNCISAKDKSEYKKQIISVEKTIIDNFLVVPILSCRGIDLVSKDLEIDTNLNSDWGFRANAIQKK